MAGHVLKFSHAGKVKPRRIYCEKNFTPWANPRQKKREKLFTLAKAPHLFVMHTLQPRGACNGLEPRTQPSAAWKLCASEPVHTLGRKDNDARCQRPSNECRRVPKSTARSLKTNNARSRSVTRPLRSRPTFSEGPLQSIFVTDSQHLPEKTAAGQPRLRGKTPPQRFRKKLYTV